MLQIFPRGRSAMLQIFPRGRSAMKGGRSAKLQTFPEGGRSAMLQIFRGKVCNIADLPGGKVCKGEGLEYNTGVCRPPGRSSTFRPSTGRPATLQTFPHFCKVPDSHFRMYRKKDFNHNNCTYKNCYVME